MVFHRGLIRFPFPCDSIRFDTSSRSKVLKSSRRRDFLWWHHAVETWESTELGDTVVARVLDNNEADCVHRRGGTYKVSQSLGLIYLPHYILVARSMNECMHACICLQTARNKQTDELTSKESQYDRHVTRSFVRSFVLCGCHGVGATGGIVDRNCCWLFVMPERKDSVNL